MKKFLLALIIVIATPALAFAQSKYVPLIDIPLLTQAGDTGFSGYINFLYSLSIGIAGLLAVIKIIVAGVKYMFSDVITDKGSAKKEIQGALFGLLLILGAYIILNTINPQLVTGKPNFKALPDRPDLIKRPASISVASNAAADAANADAAAAAARAGSPSGGCGSRSQSTQGNLVVQTLDLSGCVNDAGKTNALGLFRTECQSHKGTFGVDLNKPTCSWPKAGTVTSRYGNVTQQASTFTTTATRVDSVAQIAELKTACEDKMGKATVKNGPTGTFTGASVTCAQPAIISYSGSQSQYAKGDCIDRVPQGTLVSGSSLKLGFGIDYYCVIRYN